MRRFCQSLTEKERRRYAAVEALNLGWGGIRYISQLFECDDKPIRDGIKELEDTTALNQRAIRRSAGGRKSAFETIAGLDEVFLRGIAQHTAGSPMDETVKWTNLTRQAIVLQLGLRSGDKT